jgi:hypothetical protein
MKMGERRTCPARGTEFSGAIKFCPVSMLHGAPSGDVEPGESTSQVAFAFDLCSLFLRDHINFHPRSIFSFRLLWRG